MAIFGFQRGHLICCEGIDNQQWVYADNGESAKASRPCVRCGREHAKDQNEDWRHDDTCIANLPGVVAACCGHGVEGGYRMYEDGHTEHFNLEGKVISEKECGKIMNDAVSKSIEKLIASGECILVPHVKEIK